jgi:phospholipid/cholesterol/gamma-HCH transport system substrate-binding protein
VPSRKEIQWAQLRVGLLVLAAAAVLVGLIFLMNSSSGGPFSHKLRLRCYFSNANGIKDGSPVTLEGVTIGNVIRVRVVPERTPTPVEVTMRVGRHYLADLHTDSTAAISAAGVLGDSFVDIDSTHAKGPQPVDNAELVASDSPGLQDVVHASSDALVEVKGMLRRIQTTLDAVNSGQGTVGRLMSDRDLARKISSIATNLDTITKSVAAGNGTLGKLVTDDSFYTRANSAVERLDRIATAIDQGHGTMGKLVHDDQLYTNLNSAIKNTNQIVAEINAGHGAAGKLVHDPELAAKLDDTVRRLDSILSAIDEGKGTMGQLVQNRALYDHADQTMDQSQQLLKAIRENPKKYFVIRLKMF